MKSIVRGISFQDMKLVFGGEWSVWTGQPQWFHRHTITDSKKAQDDSAPCENGICKRCDKAVPKQYLMLALLQNIGDD